MNTSNFQKSNHICIILKTAVCSRLFLLALIIFWRSLFEPYDTSAPLNPNCLSLESQPEDTVLWPKIGAAIEGSIVWDAVYFVRIAQCGYEYEQSYAFLPLLPICISFLSQTVFAPLIPLIGHRAVLGLSGYVLNNIAFVLAAVYFYKTKKRHSELQYCFASIQLPYSIHQYTRRVCMPYCLLEEYIT